MPNNENEWGDIVREAGNAVANEMENSRHEMPVTSLIKINIERSPDEEHTEQREEQSKASQEGLTRLRRDMPREEKYEWFAWFEEITAEKRKTNAKAT